MSIIRHGNLNKLYKRNLKHQFLGSEDSIKKEMAENALNIFSFHVKNNPRYRELLEAKGFDYSNIKNISWENIPVIDKTDLRKFYPELKSETFNYTGSGGSTGTPFQYPSSKECALNIWPAHWLMYEMCGGHPYDKVLMLMGYGNPNKELKKVLSHKFFKTIKQTLYHKISNFYTFSALEMDNMQMNKMYHIIQKKKIKFIYGYASAINQFLRYLKDNNLNLDLKGIFSTSDNKVISSYQLARKFCNCEVYDQYGAHDGDIFTFECSEHNGLHILHDMCTVEIINNEIILTAVKNYAFPFIRYKVGDISKGQKLITEKCKCGRTLFRLEGIEGRTNYYTIDNNGETVSLRMFTYLLNKDSNILQYQIIEFNNSLNINVISDIYNLTDLNNIYSSIFSKKLNKDIKFILNQDLYKLKNGKVPLYYKINNLDNDKN